MDRPAISAKFHNGMAEVIAAGCGAIRELLREEGFEIFVHHQVPTNDGGISLGRALVANARCSGNFLDRTGQHPQADCRRIENLREVVDYVSGHTG